MKKLAHIGLAGAIALGGLGVGTVADLPLVPGGHIKEADAASSYGVSVNTTKTYWTNNESINIKISNGNTYEVRLVGQLQYLEKGKWVNKPTSSQWYALPGEKFGMSVDPIVTDGTYRYRMAVYKVNQPEINYDGTFAGYLYTSNFYVK
ncbi:DUF5065 domain-containing protein [Priestia aryabhattai]|uniref:DUF5065 domain-containing protein n=1 Tax=Priestia aryabhattai TaxID=412384 RepID=UPI000BF573C8|nr:DUF5065 domain-containing protein [Priestia aryabhattai]PFW74250.1 DUF5065 domain-containing protein [Priestia aryabhattai]